MNGFLPLYKMKPFIRWSGNKSKYLRYLLPHLPNQYNTYIEPFVGSGALFLHVMPHQWIINDVNTDLMDLWIFIHTTPLKVLKQIQRVQDTIETLPTIAEKRQYCSRVTQRIPKLRHGFTRAMHFLTMKHMAYMGHVITNNKYIFPGFTNKPIHMFTEEYANNIMRIHEFMKQTNGNIYNDDYTEIIRKAKPNDFMFLDPPYLENHGYKFSYNLDNVIDNTFINTLAEQLHQATNRGVKWMMTQADTKEVRLIFKQYKIIKYPVFRKQSNTWKSELIIKNY